MKLILLGEGGYNGDAPIRREKRNGKFRPDWTIIITSDEKGKILRNFQRSCWNLFGLRNFISLVHDRRCVLLIFQTFWFLSEEDGRGKVISWQNWEDSSEIMLFVHAVLIRQQSGSWQIDVITIGVATMCVRGTFCDIQKVSKLRLTRYFCARNSLGPSRAQRQSCVRRGKRAEDNSAFVCLSASVERKALPPHFRLPLGNSREFCV